MAKKATSDFIKFMESSRGSMVFSILLGLGIAAMFRKACTDNKCVIVQSPDLSELSSYYYKTNDTCYKYTPIESECDE